MKKVFLLLMFALIVIFILGINFAINGPESALLDTTPATFKSNSASTYKEPNKQSKDKEAEYYYLRGLAYKIDGNDMLAIAEYNRAIDLKPDYALAYYHRGLAKIDFKELKTAGCLDFATASRLGYHRADTVAAIFCR